MGKKSEEDEKVKPGSSQDAGAPQDEAPGAPPGETPEHDQRQSAPGKSKKNEKPKPVERKKKKQELLSDNADIHDETTI